jgi:spore maturation protein CgeB
VQLGEEGARPLTRLTRRAIAEIPMKIVIFCHSLLSDWNHGNAHFLRGLCLELLARGVEVRVYEPQDAWSVQNLLEDSREDALERFESAYPTLRSIRYQEAQLDLRDALRGADMVLVHEWNSPELVRRIGEHHAAHPDYSLFFHDTHHRSITAAEEMRRYDLSHYDAVLAFGEVVRRTYLKNGWSSRAFTWHEAADVRTFSPRVAGDGFHGDLVWIGNFGDDERTAELQELLIEPVRRLGLKAKVYGVRYPKEIQNALAGAGIEYGGYLPNWEVPRVFSEHRVTVHVPRRPYAERLPGIPTIRPFEALACGIPLVSAPWSDAEHLFTPGSDYLLARDSGEMERALTRLLADRALRERMGRAGRRAIEARHTCAHRVSELFAIHRELLANPSRPRRLEALKPAAPLTQEIT